MSSRADHRVLVPLPDGRWIALAPDAFREALTAGSMFTPAALRSGGAANASDSEPLLDADKVAAALALPVTWIEAAARQGRIPSIQAGRRRRFKRGDVERALAADGGRYSPAKVVSSDP